MSLEAKQIHPAVQKALYRKIDGLNKLFIGTNKEIGTVSTALDVGNNINPIEQQMARMCWARLTAAIKDPDKKGLDGLSDQPVYFSSYIEQSDEGRIVENANRPLTYNKRSAMGYFSPDAPTRFGENKDNIFRGETGITQVSVEQLSFFVKKMTISFSCPDPIDFEERIQPIFLRHGQYCAVEFGWGMNDTDIKTPPLSLKDIQKLNSSVKERNLALAGNYQCDVGIVSNYTFSLNADGGYEGTIDILSRGQNILNQTSQNDSEFSRDVLSVQTSVQNLRELDEIKKELTDEDLVNLTEDEKKAVLGSTNELDDIQRAKILYKKVILDLEVILDSYLEKDSIQGEEKLSSIKEFYPQLGATEFDSNMGQISYQFKKGVLKTQREATGTDFTLVANSTTRKHLTDLAHNKYFISWGWFEDHILNSFFSVDINITKGGKTGEEKTLQSIRSVTNEDGVIKSNKCHISKDLWTKGLDSVILPNRIHPTAFVKDSRRASFTMEEAIGEVDRRNTQAFARHKKLAGVHLMFKIINDNFKSFTPEFVADEVLMDPDAEGLPTFADEEVAKPINKDESSEYGLIRNMVFPVGKFIEHFANMETLKQGLRSFWADVQNEYGGFWAFGIGQDQDNTGRIGIYDLYYNSEAEKADLFVSDNQSTREDFVNYKYKRFINPDTGEKSTDKTDKIFTFPLYSKDSFVKSFNLNVKMSSKAATIAVYGGNTNVATGTQRSGDLNDLSLTAYSLLLNPTRKEKTKSQTLSEIKQSLNDGLVSKMSFPIDDDMVGTGTDNYDKSSITINSPLNNEGIDFHNSNIKFTDDTLEILNRIEDLDEVSDSRAYYDWYKQGAGTKFYDTKGRMKSSYVRTMLFLINNSLFEGDESNIQMTKPVIPIDIDMTIDGVGGLKPFDLFRLDYLPEIYRNYTYFQIFDVGHTITPSGWETSITAKMKLDLPKYLKDYPGTLKDKVTKELFFDFRTEEERTNDTALIANYESQIYELREKINEMRPKADIQAAYYAAKEKEDFDGTFKIDGVSGPITLTLETQILIEVLDSGSYRIIKLKDNPNYEPFYSLGSLGPAAGERPLYVPKGEGVRLFNPNYVPDIKPKKFIGDKMFSSESEYQRQIDEYLFKIDGLEAAIEEVNQRGKEPIPQEETNNGNNQESY